MDTEKCLFFGSDPCSGAGSVKIMGCCQRHYDQWKTGKVDHPIHGNFKDRQEKKKAEKGEVPTESSTVRKRLIAEIRENLKNTEILLKTFGALKLDPSQALKEIKLFAQKYVD